MIDLPERGRLTTISVRVLSTCATVAAILIGWEAACAQQAPSGSLSFQLRIQEVARALRDDPRVKNLSEQQRYDAVEFIVGNTLFILAHEMGHVFISEMNLPVLGREEDQADTFAAIALLRVGASFSDRVLTDASQGWFFNARRDQQTGAAPLYYDDHNLSPQRAYQIVCLMVGSDPAKFKNLANEVKIPESRQQSCKDDYGKVSRSWDMVLKPHERPPNQPASQINISYGDAKGDLEVFAQSFRAIRILETVAERAAADYEWPAPFTMEMLSCDGPNAGWDDQTRILRVCYQLAFDFAQLYRAYGYSATLPKQAPISRRQRRK